MLSSLAVAERGKGLSCGALIGLVVLGAVVVLGGLGYLAWTSRGTGARCERDDDCNTRACLLDPLGSGACTEICTTDEDCPEDMRCDLVVRDRTTPFTDRERTMCVPVD